MNLYEAFTSFVTAITLAIFATFGLGTPEMPQNAPVATTSSQVAPLIETASDAIVATNSDPNTDKEKAAYDLGKAVGYLKGIAEQLPTTTPIVTPPPVVQSPQPTPLPTSNPQPMPEPEPTPAPAPVSNAHGEIRVLRQIPVYKVNDYTINPDGTLSGTEPTDDNSANLSFILFKDDGVTSEKDALVSVSLAINGTPVAVMKNADGTITTTASSTAPFAINGTGNINKNFYPGKDTYYYPFKYEFRKTGEHTITFTSGNISESITLRAE